MARKQKSHRKISDVAGCAAKVSELKAGLSAYLERVKRGGQVVITERGRCIAKLIPIPQAETDEAAWIQELERRGILSSPEHPGVPPEYWALELPDDPEGLVLKGLLQEREESW